jgi:hypothetical protein
VLCDAAGYSGFSDGGTAGWGGFPSDFFQSRHIPYATPEPSSTSEAFLAVLPTAAASEVIAGRTHRLNGKKLWLLQLGHCGASKTVSQSMHRRAFWSGKDIVYK